MLKRKLADLALMSEITLKAIEQLLDKKLDENLKPIKADISGLKADISGLKVAVSGLKAEVSGIRTGMALLATSEELAGNQA
jgi:hypothetical protein